MNREQQLIEAAMQYEQMLANNVPVTIRDFILTVDPELRDELAALLEYIISMEQPQEPIILTPEEQALAERSLERARVRWQHHTTIWKPAPASSSGTAQAS